MIVLIHYQCATFLFYLIFFSTNGYLVFRNKDMLCYVMLKYTVVWRMFQKLSLCVSATLLYKISKHSMTVHKIRFHKHKIFNLSKSGTMSMQLSHWGIRTGCIRLKANPLHTYLILALAASPPFCFKHTRTHLNYINTQEEMSHFSFGRFPFEELCIFTVVWRIEAGIDEDVPLSYSFQRSRPFIWETQTNKQLQQTVQNVIHKQNNYRYLFSCNYFMLTPQNWHPTVA